MTVANITVYGRIGEPPCPACDYTRIFLAKAGVPFTFVDIDVNTEGRKLVAENGILELPMVVTDTETWNGYRREKLKDLVASHGRR